MDRLTRSSAPAEKPLLVYDGDCNFASVGYGDGRKRRKARLTPFLSNPWVLALPRIYRQNLFSLLST